VQDLEPGRSRLTITRPGFTAPVPAELDLRQYGLASISVSTALNRRPVPSIRLLRAPVQAGDHRQDRYDAPALVHEHGEPSRSPARP